MITLNESKLHGKQISFTKVITFMLYRGNFGYF